MLPSIKKIFKEKGQGLTEYALIFAFVAMIAYAMIEGEIGIKATVSSTFSMTQSKISEVSR